MECNIKTRRYGDIKYYIDDEDMLLIEGWRLSVIRMSGKYFYIQVNVNGVKEYLHRLIMGNPKGLVIDHINHNTLDNRKCNLRAVERRQNYFNQDKICRKKRKLTKEGVDFIRESNLSNNKLAKIFGVSNCLISKVKNKLHYGSDFDVDFT